MIAAPESADITRFRLLLLDLLGWHFDESKCNSLAKVLHHRTLSLGFNYSQYLDQLAKLRSGDEIGNLARELTVTETYFLRNLDQFKAYTEVALPNCGASKDSGQRIDILSAGCASGEEPYSLAIAANEYSSFSANRLSITGIDINPAMLQKASRAQYSKWSLRECPQELKDRWFARDGDAFVLNDAIRRSVNFETRNLSRDAPEFWRPNRFDIVFCRNVLMYFSAAQMQAAIARIARAITPGGYLFLGHAETLRGISNDFHLCHTHGTFYYQRKEQLTPYVAPYGSTPQPEVNNWQPAIHHTDTSWIAAIQGASERIHALMPPIATVGEATYTKTITTDANNDVPRQSANLDRALESLRSEQFGQTLRHLGDLDDEHAFDPDVLLLKAISLSQSGALTLAETACRELLQRDEMSAGAHYVLALCREGAGDIDGALEHDQTAVYLDPAFAMPRFHIGLLTRRRGDRQAARQDLGEALALLQKEDASRILLFGGGFKREALIGLCRAELAALGETR